MGVKLWPMLTMIYLHAVFCIPMPGYQWELQETFSIVINQWSGDTPSERTSDPGYVKDDDIRLLGS